MKIVINTCFGSVAVETMVRRKDPKLIEDVETGRFVGHVFEGAFGGMAETLKVIEIPDDVTDYHIVNYDGCEGVIYCIDNKIYYEGSPECKDIFNTDY